MSAQSMEALAMARRQHIAGAKVRKELADGNLDIASAVRDPRAGALTVEKLLRSVPGVGRVKILAILRRAEIVTRSNFADPTRRVRDLTDRQCDALIDAVASYPLLQKAA